MNEFVDIFTSSDPENIATSVKLLLLLTVLSLAPGLLILMTSFTRILIVLSFVRTSLATQQMPPNPGVDRNCFVFDVLHHGPHV